MNHSDGTGLVCGRDVVVRVLPHPGASSMANGRCSERLAFIVQQAATPSIGLRSKIRGKPADRTPPHPRALPLPHLPYHPEQATSQW